MIMAGFEYMGEMPFRNVYFTGIIRDKQGRKMSKTLGNSPDPLDLIAKYGADALRFGVMRSAPLGAGHSLRREERRARPQLLHEALERRALPADAGRRDARGEIDPDAAHQRRQMDPAAARRRDHAKSRSALDEYRFSDADRSALPLLLERVLRLVSRSRARPRSTAPTPRARRTRSRSWTSCSATRCGSSIRSCPSSPRSSGTAWASPATCPRPGRQDHHVRALAQAARRTMNAPTSASTESDERSRSGEIRSGESRPRAAARLQHRQQQARALRPRARSARCPRTMRDVLQHPAQRRAARRRRRTLDRAQRHAHRAHAARRTLPAARRTDRRRRRTRAPRARRSPRSKTNSPKSAPSSPTRTSPRKSRPRCSKSTASARADWAEKLAQLQRMLEALGA